MKQFITLGEMKSHLSPDGDVHIAQLIEDGYVEGTILTIGKMIEFLGDEYLDYLLEYDNENGCLDCDVCDCLWEAVKKELSEQ